MPSIAISDDEDVVEVGNLANESQKSSKSLERFDDDDDELAADEPAADERAPDLPAAKESPDEINVQSNAHEEEDEDGEHGDDGKSDRKGSGDEEIYAVEKILSHMLLDDNTLKFKVKWEGYDKKADQTWEPEENLLEDASDVLNEYYDSIGGREIIFEQTAMAVKTKKRARPASDNLALPAKRSRKNGTHPLETSPPASISKTEFRPPGGSWEDLIDTLDACQDEKTHKLVVYATWKNGYKSRHEPQVIYKRCPQKMLQFYERHVRIINLPDPEETPESLLSE